MGVLAVQGRSSILEAAQSQNVSEIDRNDVAHDYERDGRIPGEAGANDSRIDPVVGGTQQIPAEAKRVRCKGNDELTGDEQERKVVREVVGDGDGNEAENEVACHLDGREGAPSAFSKRAF